MPQYEFRLILDTPSLTDAEADALCAAGCDDGVIVRRDGVTFVDFGREVETLEAAISSAADDVRRTGLRVQKVELDAPASIASGA